MGYYGVRHDVTVIPYSKIRSLLKENDYNDVWENHFEDNIRSNDCGVNCYLEVVDESDEYYKRMSDDEKRTNTALKLVKDTFEINDYEFIMWVSW